MLNKIDKRLIDKIQIQECTEKELDIIVRVKDFYNSKVKIKDYAMDIIDLPIISSFGMRVNKKDVIRLSKIDDVEYIQSDLKVCQLIYESKKVINVDKLNDGIKNSANHSCVVIDTGVYPHIDFCLGKNRIVKFIDLINGRDLPYDDNGHGTFVTGILSGNSIISKYSGVDERVNLIVIKALDGEGETSSLKILQAMQWVVDNKEKYNIKVVCMSFGTMVETKIDPLIYGAEVLWDNGIVVVSAGGNSGPDESTIMSPGASSKIITVGSLKVLDNEYKVADFSSRGPILGNYKPDMVVPGVDIISTNIFDEKKEFYTRMSGTSVSTPMVAGVVSLLLRINPYYSPNQIKYMLINSCIPINGDRNAEGFGRLDLSKIKLL